MNNILRKTFIFFPYNIEYLLILEHYKILIYFYRQKLIMAFFFIKVNITVIKIICDQTNVKNLISKTIHTLEYNERLERYNLNQGQVISNYNKKTNVKIHPFTLFIFEYKINVLNPIDKVLCSNYM